MKAYRFHSTGVRLAAIAAVMIAWVLAAFVIIWTVANTSAVAAEQKEVADLLAWISPADPQTHRAAAIIHEQAYEPGDLEIALLEYEKAAAASPGNFLYWLLLGSARTRAGEFEKAEAALLRASTLAPHYSRVRWALGNLLLRQGRDREGYDEIRKAIAGDPALSASAITLAMQLTGGDLPAVRSEFDKMPEAQVQLSILLLNQKRFDEAREVWHAADVKIDTSRLKEIAGALQQTAIAAKQFRLAAAVASKIDGSRDLNIGTVSNRGFESPVRVQETRNFEWRVPQAPFPQYAITDAQKLSGQYSLLAAVNTSDAKDFQGISQIVAVEPGAKYSLKIAYRSDLESKTAFFWEVRSASDLKPIAKMPAMPRSDNWTPVAVVFDVPSDVDGIELRLMREPCTASACASNGNFWFDDVELFRK